MRALSTQVFHQGVAEDRSCGYVHLLQDGASGDQTTEVHSEMLI